jgi:hypothetical protein
MEDFAEAASAASLWAGLCLLLYLFLSVQVVRQRRTHQVAIGDAGVEPLVRAGRAFGNASEYLPVGFAVMALLVLVGSPPISLHLAGATLFLGRLSHAIGLGRTTGPSLPRAAGMVLTWLFLVGGAVTLLFHAV